MQLFQIWWETKTFSLKLVKDFRSVSAQYLRFYFGRGLLFSLLVVEVLFFFFKKSTDPSKMFQVIYI